MWLHRLLRRSTQQQQQQPPVFICPRYNKPCPLAHTTDVVEEMTAIAEKQLALRKRIAWLEQEIALQEPGKSDDGNP